MKKSIQFPFPVFITKEGTGFVAECPTLRIATQGKTEKELKENMRDLIEEYLKDPDTFKPYLKMLDSSSFTYISVPVPQKLLHGKTYTIISK